MTKSLESSRFIWGTANKQLQADLSELKAEYIFRNENAIASFIASHRASAAILTRAIPQLKKFFGENVVFSLQAVSDDDGSTSLYAIVVWRGPAEGAESALEDFDECWWLNQHPQSELTFTYELA